MTNEAMDNIISDDSTSGGEGETTYPERAVFKSKPIAHSQAL